MAPHPLRYYLQDGTAPVPVNAHSIALSGRQFLASILCVAIIEPVYTLVMYSLPNHFVIIWIPWFDIRSCDSSYLQIKHVLNCLRVVLIEVWGAGKADTDLC